jgi:hypothetical protein
MTGNLDDAPSHTQFYPGLVNRVMHRFHRSKGESQKKFPSVVDKHANKD